VETDRLAPVRLELAYDEVCAPTLAEAVRALAADGATAIVAVPSMLTPGVHTELEIPESIDAPSVELRTSTSATRGRSRRSAWRRCSSRTRASSACHRGQAACST
jgi:sirohydrochlorin ferrochelatase